MAVSSGPPISSDKAVPLTRSAKKVFKVVLLNQYLASILNM